MATSSVAYNKPVLPRVSDTSDLASNRASVYSGKALSFDGVNDEVALGPLKIATTGNMAFSAYFSTTNSAVQYIFQNNSLYIATNRDSSGGAGKLSVYISSGSWIDTGVFVGDGKLHHLVVSLVDSAVTIYLDGAAILTGVTRTYSNSGFNAFIGQRDGGSRWSGYITGVRWYDTGLTAAQVAELYNNPEQILPTGVAAVNLKLWLPMMEGAGSYVYNGAAGSLGEELVSNGTVDEVCQKWAFTDNGYLTATGGKLVWNVPNGSGSTAVQYLDIEANKTYRVTFDYSLNRDGFSVILGNANNASAPVVTGTGTYTIDLTPTSTNGGLFSLNMSAGTGDLTGYMDNISVKEVVPQATGTISGATWVAGVGEPVPQTALIDWNKSTNLVIQSENFGGGDWVKNNTLVLDNVMPSPIGALNADYLYTDTSNTTHRIYQNLTAFSGTGNISFSVYVKYNNHRYFSFGPTDDSIYRCQIAVDLLNGTITAVELQGSTTLVSSSIENVGSGWYKVSGVINATGAWANNLYLLGMMLNQSTFSSGGYTGTGTGLYIWGAQCQFSSTVDTYLPTVATAQSSPVLLPEGLTASKDIFGSDIVSPRSAGAFNFDLQSYVKGLRTGYLPTGNGARTLEVWVYYKPNGLAQSLLEIGSGVGTNQRFGLLANPTNTGSVYIVGQGNDNQFANVLIESNQWTHLVVTHDGTTLNLYKNGVIAGTVSETYDTIDVGYTIGLEQRTSTPSSISGAYEWCQSQVAIPRIYNYALTAEQVADNFNQKASTFGKTKVVGELQAYINRTVAAGATVEAHSALLNTLTELENK